MSDDKPEPELTAADVFGEPVPGEAVCSTYGNPTAGYRQRPAFRRRSDGRLYPVDAKRDQVEEELPDDYCPD